MPLLRTPEGEIVAPFWPDISVEFVPPPEIWDAYDPDLVEKWIQDAPLSNETVDCRRKKADLCKRLYEKAKKWQEMKKPISTKAANNARTILDCSSISAAVTYYEMERAYRSMYLSFECDLIPWNQAKKVGESGHTKHIEKIDEIIEKLRRALDKCLQNVQHKPIA